MNDQEKSTLPSDLFDEVKNLYYLMNYFTMSLIVGI